MAGSKKKPASKKRTSESGSKETRKTGARKKATRTTKTSAKASSRAPEGPASGSALRTELEEARETIRRLEEDRDNQVALAEAADMERSILAAQLEESLEKLKKVEQRPPQTPLPAPRPDEELDYEEADEETETEDLDDVEAIYDRLDDPRVRRQELDRERLDRESEAGDEPYWMVCPKCGGDLEEVETEEVKVDRCENCAGLFLDPGEVEMLLNLGRGAEGLGRIRNVLQI
ncbi:MAG: hypothetical protein GF346_02935 [Candidatus Eisenbacteria bacterium]|nr:hypothetical protein [Candidatus Latescibacterota bacterium]MBD3301376.1 hypothetical protein [Candidatus Eisenbacteria bacterium]